MSRQPTLGEYQQLHAYTKRLERLVEKMEEQRLTQVEADAIVEENRRLKAINRALTQRNQILANREKGLQ
jgi:hypothetical protein